MLLWFAAWTSSISMAEPLVVILKNKLNYSRVKSSVVIGCLAWIIGVLCLLSFNIFKSAELNIFNIIVNLSTNILLPLGVFGFAIFIGWMLPKQFMKDALNVNNYVFNIWLFLIKFIAPVVILVAFIYRNYVL